MTVRGKIVDQIEHKLGERRIVEAIVGESGIAPGAHLAAVGGFGFQRASTSTCSMTGLIPGGQRPPRSSPREQPSFSASPTSSNLLLTDNPPRARLPGPRPPHCWWAAPTSPSPR